MKVPERTFIGTTRRYAILMTFLKWQYKSNQSSRKKIFVLGLRHSRNKPFPKNEKQYYDQTELIFIPIILQKLAVGQLIE